MKKIIILAVFLFSTFSFAKSSEKFPDDSIYLVKSKWIDLNSKEISLGDLAGQNIVISMVYMSCKYSCPLTVNYMKEIEKAMPAELLGKVQFVLVSFDPQHDTPQKMKEYLEQHKMKSPPWYFMTSKKEQNIRELSALLDFKYKKTEEGEFEHSFSLIALNKQGVIVGRLDGIDMKPTDILNFFKDKK